MMLGAAAAQAADVTVAVSAHARAELVAEVAAVAPGRPFRIGLRLTLAPGWHTYFENPGDAGAAADLALDLPVGAVAGPIAWPAPRPIAEGPLVVFGYRGTVLLAREVTPPADLVSGSTFRVGLSAAWLVCGHVCIPEEGEFALTLPVAAAPVALLAASFDQASVPPPAPFTARARFAGSSGALRIEPAPPAASALFIARAPFVLAAATSQPVTRDGGGLTLALTRGPEPLPAVLRGVLLLTDADGATTAFDLAVPVEP